MSRKQSFEEALRQKMNELPLPDETASWQKMNALLDEKKKRRPFFFFKNEKMVGGALLLCALLVWVALFVQKETGTTKPVAYKDNVPRKAGKDIHANRANATNKTEEGNTEKNVKQVDFNHASSFSIPSTITPSSGSANSPLSSQNKNRAAGKHQNDFKERRLSFTQPENQDGFKKNKSFSAQLYTRRKAKEQAQKTDTLVLQKQNSEVTKLNAPERKQSFSVIHNSPILPAATDTSNTSTADKTDSSGNAATAETHLPKTDSAFADNATTKTSIKIKPRSTWFIDAGIGIKQQIPIDSQRFVSYNYNGNKSWFGDYVPFLYLRLEKEKKWFLQGEFHYAAPRLVKDIPYWQTSKVDYGHSTAETERYELQKVWYNEVPLSLNIYIRPSWSVGAGAMVSWLRGAAVQRTTAVYNVSSGQYNGSNKQLPWKGFTDSFLYRNNTSLLLQTDYRISKWWFGIRYLHDLHPYLTYTLPAGDRRDERNASLEIMIRYRLYRSDKFRIGKL